MSHIFEQTDLTRETLCGVRLREDRLVEALLRHLCWSLECVYWNLNQKVWDHSNLTWGGFTYRAPHDESDGEIEFDGTVINLYKGMSGGCGESAYGGVKYITEHHTPEWWEGWFHRAHQEIQKHDTCPFAESSEHHRGQVKDCKHCHEGWVRRYGNPYPESNTF